MLELKITDIKKSFDEEIVLKGIHMDLKQGDIVLIQGGNGCGKSTLLKILCDILSFDSGRIETNGKSRGALIENPGFLEYETLAFNLKVLAKGKRYDEKRIQMLCALFQLDYNDKTILRSYSLGMRQKVGIIQALMDSFDLLYFDEPIRGLDEMGIKAFSEIINKESKQHITMIASHDALEQIQFTSIYQMEKGRLINRGGSTC